MTAYTFFFEIATFADARLAEKNGEYSSLAYVTGKDKWPFKQLKDGDELFVVGLDNHRVLLGGRLVVDGSSVDRATAEMRLGTRDLLGKDRYAIGKSGTVKQLQTNLFIPDEIAKDLELFKSTGLPTKAETLRRGRPDPGVFRSNPRLSLKSAEVLRAFLNDQNRQADGQDRTGDSTEGLDVVVSAGFDDDAYRSGLIRSRRGQNRFRRALLGAYSGKCQITHCAVEPILEAAHITPHAEHTDYDLRNGLLLRADVHTLFDLDLIGVDKNYRVVVHSTLLNSEYRVYQGRLLDRFPASVADNPDREALQKRLDRWV